MVTNEQMTELTHEGMHLDLTPGTRLVIMFANREQQFRSSFIGMVPNAYVIVRKPSEAGIDNILAESEGAIVRYMKSGVAHGFGASVIGHIEEPFRLLFLSYPESIESIGLRRRERMECFIPAIATVRGQECAGAVIDISETGFRFSTRISADHAPPMVELGDELSVSFRLLGASTDQVLSGRVRHSSLDTERFIIGTEFEQLDQTMLDEVKKFVGLVEDFRATPSRG